MKNNENINNFHTRLEIFIACNINNIYCQMSKKFHKRGILFFMHNF